MNDTSPIMNWLDNKPDKHSRPGAANLQSSIHTRLMDQFSSEASAAEFLTTGKTYWRQQAVIKSQYVMGSTFSGTILEIGAGTGWCSSLLSTVDRVERIYCSDYDPIAVKSLMPQVQKHWVQIHPRSLAL